MRGLAPSNSPPRVGVGGRDSMGGGDAVRRPFGSACPPMVPPLNLPAIWHTAHGTIRGAVVVAPLTPFHVCQIHSRLGQGKGRWELALTSTLFPVWSSASPARQFRNPPSGRDCCASSVAAPLPCPLGCAEMEGFHPSKPPRERGFAPLSKPAVQRFVICHLSHYFSDVVSEK